MDEEPDVYAMIATMRASGDLADKIVAAIWSDGTDRRGWRQEHDQFDPDVQVEIVETWLEKVRGLLSPSLPA